MTTSDAITEFFPLKKLKQSDELFLEAEHANAGEQSKMGITKVIFLPPLDAEQYVTVKTALDTLRESVRPGAEKLGLRTDDDVFNYMKAKKKFE